VVSHRPGYGAAEGEALAETDAEADADDAGDAEAEADGTAEPLGTLEGRGTGVGSGMNRDGIPRAESTSMRTKARMTTTIHGRARRSLRGGRAPR
jgi:hypothetical protein